ncbi:DUF2726 domain-containing protein [Gayadomonas joobiniege]|uniref:DUF2726 domain-containing protein n=1 Tax=Gayadomonas joobiniege TaxID=1234606 RepID=UPI000375F7B8|nr:DUF2726 domain-containing protein [Gayadomonas joobiniege]
MELAIIALMIILLVVAAVAIRMTQSGTPFPYQKKSALFSEPERAFMVKLEQAIGEEFRIINRVKLSDLVTVNDKTNNKNAQVARRKAAAKTLDFVLLDRKTLAPVAAIDLANTDQPNGHKAKADWFVRGALETVGLPHIRIKIKAGYRAAEIRECLAARIGRQKLAPLKVKPVVGQGPTRPVKPLSSGLISRPQAVA